MHPTRMKRCPSCRRDYFDDSLTFCLDDGARLLEGPAPDGGPTALMSGFGSVNDASTLAFEEPVTTAEIEPGLKKKPWATIAIAVALLLIAGLGWMAYTFYAGRTHQIESIAVMPFINTGANPDLEYLSDGITESLINSLSQVPTLSVKARSSVFTYKGKEVTPQQVARDLSVEAVLMGRVVQRADQVVLNVELVDAATGNQLWGDQYTRKIADLAQLQSDIARDVSGTLRAKLTGDQQDKVAKNYTANTEAYQLYLRGRHHWNKRKADDIRKSIEYFQQAIDKDPTYALAYAALAEAYTLIPTYRQGPAAEYYPKARAAAMKAIEIDESLAEAHNALANVASNYDWKFHEAEVEFRKAISLNPSYASAHQWYGEFLISMGRTQEALVEMKRAQELDPLSIIINGLVGVTLRHNGQPDQALEQLKKTLELDPNFPRTHLFLGELYQSVGRFEEAVDELGKHAVLNGIPEEVSRTLALKAKTAARTGGEKGFSRAMAEIMENPVGQSVPPATVLANYWIRAGEVDKGFAILEKGYQERDESMLGLKSYRFDPVKNDPRYKDLIRRIGLPE
jgi:eukaryotic-like serine/threonine-protein kinase